MRDRVPARCARKYVAREVLARGEGATVWLARPATSGNATPNDWVALKIGDVAHESADRALSGPSTPSVRAIERLTNELVMTSRVKHAHVVQVVDHDLTDEQPWIAREFLPGPTLGDHVPVGGMPWRVAAAIGIQLAGALAAVHAAGILHRDVKAGNVLKGDEGHWKLTDFDVACDSERSAADETFAGTPGYVAPEIIRGRAASVASEVYALGAVMYLMLTGMLPSGMGDALELMQRCLEHDPLPPSAHGANLPESLEALVVSALARRPEERPESMDAFRARLLAILVEPAPRKLSVPLWGAGAWGARTQPGRRTTKRMLPAAKVAARATASVRALVASAPSPVTARFRLPRHVLAMAVCLLIATCGLMMSNTVAIGESPAGAPFRVLREAAARTMALAGGFGMPVEVLKPKL